MKLLLDTHVILWWVAESPQLDDRRRDAILHSAVWYSIGSLWEIAIKVRTGRLRVDLDELADALRCDRFERLDISVEHLATLVGLPAHHRDPFDHLLIAQAISEGATLVSDDRAMRRYPVELL